MMDDGNDSQCWLKAAESLRRPSGSMPSRQLRSDVATECSGGVFLDAWSPAPAAAAAAAGGVAI